MVTYRMCEEAGGPTKTQMDLTLTAKWRSGNLSRRIAPGEMLT